MKLLHIFVAVIVYRVTADLTPVCVTKLTITRDGVYRRFRTRILFRNERRQNATAVLRLRFPVLISYISFVDSYGGSSTEFHGLVGKASTIFSPRSLPLALTPSKYAPDTTRCGLYNASRSESNSTSTSFVISISSNIPACVAFSVYRPLCIRM